MVAVEICLLDYVLVGVAGVLVGTRGMGTIPRALVVLTVLSIGLLSFNFSRGLLSFNFFASDGRPSVECLLTKIGFGLSSL